jgi:mannose-6-phosphate isomerase-like protein (cupin superfamily)
MRARTSPASSARSRTRSAASSSRCPSSVSRRTPNFEQGTGHFHDELEELYIVAAGTLTMRFGDEIEQVTAGSVARVSPRTPRSHRNEGDDPVELWAVSKRLQQMDATKLDDFWEESANAAQHG